MSAHRYWISYTSDGVLVSRDQPDAPEPFCTCHSSPEMAGFVEQLQDEAYAIDTSTGAVIPWETLYTLIDDRNYASSLHLLHLPPVGDMTLRLASQGALTDRDFRITFTGVDAARQTVALTALRGGIVQTGPQLRLLSQPVWRLARMIGAFNRRTDAERNDAFHRQQWGKIRRAAVEAKAELGDFLRRTVVLTPRPFNSEVQHVAHAALKKTSRGVR